MQRRVRGDDGVRSEAPPVSMLSESELPKKKSHAGALRLIGVVVSLAAVVGYFWPSKGSWRYPDTSIEVEKGVVLRLDLDRATFGGQEITLGPHSVILELKKECSSPHLLRMRLTGDALVPIIFERSSVTLWFANFTIPMEGTYAVEAVWYGCKDNVEGNGRRIHHSSLAEMWTATGSNAGTPIKSTNRSSNGDFPDGLWISSSKFQVEPPITSHYLWSDLATPHSSASLLQAENGLGVSTVVKEATPIPEQFGDLSNYEIVCWLGGHSAYGIYQSFLSLRPAMFPHQRPFKFHYKNLTSFTKPDQHWEDGEKERFRKCKILFVSAEDLDEPLTQSEYKGQVRTFLGHLVKAFPDDTFPIWMVTFITEPSIQSSRMCTYPSTATATTMNHPCNAALFDLFQKSPFPPRVKLLDTTDLVHPQFDENLNDVLSVIAMRVFAVVGRQVAEWRRKNLQKGMKAGLMRNGVLEPNKEYVAYEWT